MHSSAPFHVHTYIHAYQVGQLQSKQESCINSSNTYYKALLYS